MAEQESPNTIISKLVAEEGIDAIKLADISFINPEILDCVPEELAVRYKILPFARDSEGLSVAMANPFDLDAEKIIRLAVSTKPKI